MGGRSTPDVCMCAVDTLLQVQSLTGARTLTSERLRTRAWEMSERNLREVFLAPEWCYFAPGNKAELAEQS